jgi:hypothetical protein
MSIDTMSHEQATSIQAAERYALGKLGPEEREAFESHYFDCPDCFEQVRLEMHFRRHAKEVLGPEAEHERSWLSRMLADMRRPAPVFASFLVLCFAGMGAYQRNEITRLKVPRIQPSPFTVVGSSKGGPNRALQVKRKSPLPLKIEFNRAPEFTSYQAKVVAASEKFKFSLAVPVVPSDPEDKDSVTVLIPEADSLEAGSYSMFLYGVAADGSTKVVKSGKFELEFLD